MAVNRAAHTTINRSDPKETRKHITSGFLRHVVPPLRNSKRRCFQGGTSGYQNFANVTGPPLKEQESTSPRCKRSGLGAPRKVHRSSFRLNLQVNIAIKIGKILPHR